MLQPFQPPAVLHLISSNRWTGAAEPAANLALAQIRAGYKVWMCCCGGSSLEQQLLRRKIPLYQATKFDRSYNPFKAFSDVRSIRHFADEQKVDVVHCHLPYAHWIAALAVGKKSPRVLVRTIHRDKVPAKHVAHNWLYGRRTDAAMMATEERSRLLAESFAQSGLIVRAIRGSVDLEQFSPHNNGQEFRDELQLPPNAVLGGIVARITDGRGHRWLFEAIPRAMQASPNLHVALAGRGPLKKELQRIELPESCRKRVIFAGYRKDLPRVYAGLDFHILLQPGSEATCRAALEAMASGRPNVVSNRPALAEIIEHGVNGLVVRENDVEDLAAALVKLSTDAESRQGMGIAARKRAEERFTFDNLFSAVADVYSQAWQRKFERARDFVAP